MTSIFERFNITVTNVDGDGYRYIHPEDFGVSLEIGLRQFHGNIPETRYTRRISFGAGYSGKNSCISWKFGTRFYVHFHRVDGEDGVERGRLHASIYFRPYDGLSCRIYQ